MMIPWAEWRPDVAALNTNYAADINNALCADGFYRPFPQLVPISSPIPGILTGAFAAKSRSGQVTVFAGTTDKMYVFNGATLGWTDVTKTAATYQSSTIERWQFAQFGERVVAVNANDPPQSFILGSSTQFADLAGSPPYARHVAVTGDFLMLAGLLDFPNRVHWSAINDPTEWTPTVNNSDYQDFPDGGPVRGITSSTNPIIVQESAIRRGTFVPGSDVIFTFDKLQDKRGAKAKYSLAYRGDYVFFLAEDGFFQVDYSGQVTPIGFERVNLYFRSMVASDAAEKVIGTVDPVQSRVYWSFQSGSAGINDQILIYDWMLQRWTRATTSTQYILPAATAGYTLEQLDMISTDLEQLSPSLDSPVWVGGAPVLAAFDDAGRLAFFTGENAEASFQTAEYGDTSAAVVRFENFTPIIDCSDFVVSTGARMRRGDDAVWSVEKQMSSNTGRVHHRSRARFHSFKQRIPAGSSWSRAQGIDVNYTKAGLR